MRDSILFRSSLVSLLGLMCASAGADCVRLDSTNDPSLPNQFTLNFPPELGGTRSAGISYSEISLETCQTPDEARFVDYYQEVQSLTLPGEIPTGDLTILVTQSQPVAYDPATGIFSTSDFYEIHFTGDLSAYGITSPFYLPGASSGTVTYDTPTSGRIAMAWDGAAQLPNPFDPPNPIVFTYACQVNTQFTVATGCAVSGCDAADLDGDCEVTISDLSQQLANFGSNGPRVRPADGDVDGDRDVDLSDLAWLLSSFGSNCN